MTDNPNRKTKYVLVTHAASYDAKPDFVFDGPVEAMILSLQVIRDKIPAKYRAEATAEISSNYDESTVELTVAYYRPETDEEMNDRFQKEQEAYNRAFNQRRDQYFILRKEFEPNAQS